MRLFQLFIIKGIIFLYLFKQVLLLEFSLDAYHYIILLLPLLALVSAFQFKGSIPLSVVFYFLIFHLSILLYLFRGGSVAEGYYEGYFLYFLQPFILWFSLKDSRVSAVHILSTISNTVLISIAGVILYYINIFSPLSLLEETFRLEFTSVSSSVVIRNTSIYGNSLVAAGIGLVQMCSAAILVFLGRKRHLLMLFLSFIFICSTLSRRSIVAGSLLLLFLFFMSSKSTRKEILRIGSVVSVFLFIYAWDYMIILLDRFISSVDFSESNASNTSRINAIMAGIIIIFSDLVGVGMGSLSSLGKSVEGIHESETFIRVTESMYTTFIGEIGLIFAIPIFILFYISIVRKGRPIRWLLAYPFILESIMGLGLMNPAVNFMFFLIYFLPMNLESPIGDP